VLSLIRFRLESSLTALALALSLSVVVEQRFAVVEVESAAKL
jgi:hypothetical protein